MFQALLEPVLNLFEINATPNLDKDEKDCLHHKDSPIFRF